MTTMMIRLVRSAFLLAVLVAVGCSGGGTGGSRGGAGGGGTGGGDSGGETVDPTVAMKTRHLDEPGLLTAKSVNVTILPKELAAEIRIEALHRSSRIEGGNRVIEAEGRVRVKIRELEIHAEKFEAHVVDEPVEGMKILATGEARYVSEAAASPEEPQATIVLSPGAILYGLD